MAEVNILPRDQNFVTAAGFENSLVPGEVHAGQIITATGRVKVDSASGSGTVNSVSIVSANGLAGTVANATTTPAITLSTTVTGLIKGNGTAISAASDGTDYLSPTTGVTVSQSTPQTIGATGARLTKLWATDVTVTNAIAGSITGNAATVTTNANLTGAVTSSGNATSLGSFTSAQLATALTDETGSGLAVFATSPSLTTPSLGVATATSVNKVTITAPGTSATLTILNGKTLTANNTLTLAGTDSTTMTFPTTSATIARTDAAQTFVGIQTIPQILSADNAIAAVSNAATVTRANRNNVVTNNSAAGITITLSTTSAAAGDMLLVQSLPSSAVAQAITWVNTEISDVTPSANLNASTTSPRTDGFKWNPLTSKWRCIASA